MTEHLFYVRTSYFTCGVIVEDGMVVSAAPIMKWAVGKRWEEVRNWVLNRKQGSISQVE